MSNPLFKAVLLRLAILAIVVCTVLLVLTDESQAEGYAEAAIGVFNSAKHSPIETKFGQMGYRAYSQWGGFIEGEFGGWAHQAGTTGQRSSGYLATLVGVEAEHGVDLRLAVGPAIVTNPDIYLGGNFPQFTEDFFVGVRGRTGTSLGAKYKHFSSAGLVMPNIGRDFLGVEVSLPF